MKVPVRMMFVDMHIDMLKAYRRARGQGYDRERAQLWVAGILLENRSANLGRIEIVPAR